MFRFISFFVSSFLLAQSPCLQNCATYAVSSQPATLPVIGTRWCWNTTGNTFSCEDSLGGIVNYGGNGTAVYPVSIVNSSQNVSVGSNVVLTSGAIGTAPYTFQWELLAPSNSKATLNGGSTSSPTFVPDVAGTYFAQVMVTDATGNSALGFTTTTASGNSYSPPTATLPTSFLPVIVGNAVNFAGTGSDTNGNPLTYIWSMSVPAGSTTQLSSSNMNATFTPDIVGNYVIQLIVNDGVSNSAPASITIMAKNSILPPTANAGPNQTVLITSNSTINLSSELNPAFIGQTVKFDCTVIPSSVVPLSIFLNGSGTDPQSLPLIYQWSFVSLPNQSTAMLSNPTISNPSFNADLIGTYVLQLIVNNGSFSSPPSTITIIAN